MIIPLSEVLVSGFLLSLHLVLACGFLFPVCLVLLSMSYSLSLDF